MPINDVTVNRSFEKITTMHTVGLPSDSGYGPSLWTGELGDPGGGCRPDAPAEVCYRSTGICKHAKKVRCTSRKQEIFIILFKSRR